MIFTITKSNPFDPEFNQLADPILPARFQFDPGGPHTEIEHCLASIETRHRLHRVAA